MDLYELCERYDINEILETYANENIIHYSTMSFLIEKYIEDWGEEGIKEIKDMLKKYMDI